jgi:hypothetical protein
VRASSTLGGFVPNFAVDEDLRTYWSAASGESTQWFETDLGAVSTVRAIQVNYADQDATIMGRAMTKDQPYYFQIEAFNENGISARSATVKVE